MKIVGTIIINVLFSVSAICATGSASSSEAIRYTHYSEREATSGNFLAPGDEWPGYSYPPATDAGKALEIGTEGSSFHLKVSQAEAGKITVHNHSTVNQPFHIRDSIQKLPGVNRYWYGSLEPNQKLTVSAASIRLWVWKPAHSVTPEKRAKWDSLDDIWDQFWSHRSW
ncbi:hypothetical protein PCANC_04463 [Puccinia coronata f. sp. avenae]|uniref:Uncharacterized protein n=1 Tax=Puccinia coronata f. sp. avenae TaxID=200324 RepID=A0A2N5VUN2_9BASI|nr:hypothetical protein PCANC_08742 [Puccinia coronata f. sp. avenae]PLW22989.1 hypothetical protein PCASD_14791 [Puccinia coronata f. sp. avenae]PLW39538.1 hypothetical protein PCASD_07663 [Puccinia coronata f. sp. avenae]PLW53695.1 hypothetical protein PCANC_04463 [Puccinia coronata f. sp. avenae]